MPSGLYSGSFSSYIKRAVILMKTAGKIILLSALLMASGIKPVFSAEALAEVQTLISQNKLEKALLVVDRFLVEEPGNIQARFSKGIILIRMNKLDRAENIFRRLTEEYPELPEPYNNLAVIYASQGKYEKASDALAMAINTHPSYATAHENMGDIYAKMASKAYNQALEIDSNNETAREKLLLVNELFSVKGQSIAREQVSESQQQTEERAEAVEKTSAGDEKTAKETEKPSPSLVAAVDKENMGPVIADETIHQQVLNAIAAWARAWSEQDIDRYISAYSKNYTPSGNMSREQWLALRKERLSAPEFIKVSLSGIQIFVTDPNRATVTFLQKYESNTYSDRVKKRLVLKSIDGEWRIVREKSE